MNVLERNMRQFVDEYIRERVEADGGSIRFLSFDGKTLRVRMEGECGHCPVTRCGLKKWIEEEICKKFNKRVCVEQSLVKPYFLDK